MADVQADGQDRLGEWLDFWNNGGMYELHARRPHLKLEEHYDRYMHGKAKAKVFFPLCGDVIDMISLADKGHEIVGVECSELGIKSFFGRNNIGYSQESCDTVKGKLFKSKDENVNIRIYCCDLFNFNTSVEGRFDVIVDFGSMGAMLRKDLQTYADLMRSLLKPEGRHILECFVYDLEKFPDSRPLCFTVPQLKGLYGASCSVEKIDEGPNPYEDEEAKTCDTAETTTGDEQGGVGRGEPSEEESDCPDITGAAYFLIQHLQC
ncbi:thiopurine S-methyltransferase [Aplysia californica]|uniref:Thiopurine S-methyltransferase n=1 Tax=Aplysia californica TaxID=6500 RepID=A0ABM1VRU3_APLCA|nr:thiopurine S-methyltransferase [Aplysia californica]